MRTIPLPRGRIFASALLLFATMFTETGWAISTIFNINATGAKEVTVGGVPNQGDLDRDADPRQRHGQRLHGFCEL